MRQKLGVILALFFIGVSVFAGVHVENGAVVFTFKYENADVVYLAGSFNDWKPTDIPMKLVGDLWTVSLKLEPGMYQYKYVVNGTQWVVDPEAPSRLDDGFGGYNGAFVLANENGKLVVKPVENETTGGSTGTKYEYNTNREDTIHVEDGYIVIRYYDPNAEYVYISGDFNDWVPDEVEMYDAGDGWWEAMLELDPGVYQYKFFVNGEKWVTDPNAFAYVPDGYGGKNGVFEVYEVNGELKVGAPGKKESIAAEKIEKKKSEEKETEVKELPLGLSVVDGKVFFKVEKKEAEKAYLAGTFNNWNPEDIEMRNVNGYWQTSLELSPGRYEYKYVFIIGGNQVWQEDPNAPGYVPDGFGGKNGVFELVEENGVLKIKAPKKEKSGGAAFSGVYSFKYTFKRSETNLLSSLGVEHTLTLAFEPSEELSLKLRYGGAQIDSALVNFDWNGLTFKAHYNVSPTYLPLEGIGSGVYVEYDSGVDLLVDIGAEGETVPLLLGVKVEPLELFYGRDYFGDGNAVAARATFDVSGMTLTFEGGYTMESGEYVVGASASLTDMYIHGRFNSAEEKLDVTFKGFNTEFYGDFYTDGTYDVRLQTMFSDYSVYGGYEHLALVDKASLGFGIEESNYTLSFTLRTENLADLMNNLYLDIGGSVEF